MPKPELEFFKPDQIAWEPVAASATGGAGGTGVRQKILSKSEDGDVTRLLRFDAGVETTETITHDFWEEVWILEGELDRPREEARPSPRGCTRAGRRAWSTGRTGCRRGA